MFSPSMILDLMCPRYRHQVTLPDEAFEPPQARQTAIAPCELSSVFHIESTRQNACKNWQFSLHKRQSPTKSIVYHPPKTAEKGPRRKHLYIYK